MCILGLVYQFSGKIMMNDSNSQKKTPPNILLFMTDQQRGDCLGCEDHPVLMTPNLDAIAANGVRMAHCYSTCPSCIAARRSILSGQFPPTHGMVGFQPDVAWNPPATLPGELAKAGYHTALVGRPMHQHPRRKRFGYDHMVYGDEYPTAHACTPHQQAPDGFAAHGLMGNGWTARSWHLDESLHPTTSTATEAVRFLKTWRDPSKPFFLTVSFLAPHPPLCPPAFYLDRYLQMKLPDPVIGNWAQPPKHYGGIDVDQVNLSGEALRYCRAAYYAMINHVDDQICRVLQATGVDPLTGRGALSNTIVLFTSDHGEMLGDHYLFRKTYPYEASARVPLLISAPKQMQLATNSVCEQAVCLEDIMPTLLDMVGQPIPDSVEGQSLLPMLRGESTTWRPYLHGEHAPCYRLEQGNHYLTDGIEKYVWYTQSGQEQLFNLDMDPSECNDLAQCPDHAKRLSFWRNRMVKELTGRSEKFTDGKQLIAACHYSPVHCNSSELFECDV